MHITVIIPTHNRARLLDKTLSSLAQQTEKDFKVYVVDHGSTDDSREVCWQYKQVMKLEYIWLAKDRDAPGAPRHLAMKKVDTPIAVFLDCGVVVPSFYITAQVTFHQTHPHHVGIGFFHGHATRTDQDNRWDVILEQIAIDDAEKIIQQQPDLEDSRKGVPLPTALAWMHGWTGNLSLCTEDYWAVGGFDEELGYALEDVELCYRLLKHGVQFAVVENGWSIHLPHPRQPLKVRRRTQHAAWEYCYQKLRTLAIEVMLYVGMNTVSLTTNTIAQTFQYLSDLGSQYATLPSTAALAARCQFPRPSLLIGGTIQDTPYYDYLALANEDIVSSESLWSCSGIRIPLADHSLQSVVVSDAWKWFGPVLNSNRVSLLECMIADIRRVAQRAYFVHSPSLNLPENNQVSTSYLEDLCRKYDLPFQIVVPE